MSQEHHPFPVLITSAGRRVGLLQAFRRAPVENGVRVVAVDCDPLAPALRYADRAHLVPRLDDPSYVETLTRIARAENVRLVVPTIDTELALMAKLAESWGKDGRIIVISSPDFVELTADKWTTTLRLGALGIATPVSWLDPEAALRESSASTFFVKPRRGSASLMAAPVSRRQVAAALSLIEEGVIQERLNGVEITVDVLLDLSGRLVHYVPRIRLKTLAGESIEGRTLAATDLENWIERVGQAVARLGARGVITVQAFLTDRGPVLTEINPRFAGGFPLAYAAGADYPSWLIEMALGREVPARLGAYEVGMTLTRYLIDLVESAPPRDPGAGS